MNVAMNTNELSWEKLVQQIEQVAQYETKIHPTIPVVVSQGTKYMYHTIEAQKESLFSQLLQVLAQSQPIQPEQPMFLLSSSNANSPMETPKKTTRNNSPSPITLQEACPLVEESISLSNLTSEEQNSPKKRRRQFSEEEVEVMQSQLKNKKRTKFIRNSKKPYDNMVQIFKFK